MNRLAGADVSSEVAPVGVTNVAVGEVPEDVPVDSVSVPDDAVVDGVVEDGVVEDGVDAPDF